jgi:hypothetical protein
MLAGEADQDAHWIFELVFCPEAYVAFDVPSENTAPTGLGAPATGPPTSLVTCDEPAKVKVSAAWAAEPDAMSAAMLTAINFMKFPIWRGTNDPERDAFEAIPHIVERLEEAMRQGERRTAHAIRHDSCAPPTPRGKP